MDLFRNPSSLKPNRLETALGAAKLVLISMGIISTLVLLKVAIIPYAFDFLFSTFPRLLVSPRSWLSPPFVYIIVNFIIITIAASSNFHHKTTPFSSSSSSDPRHATTISASVEAAAVITNQAVPDTTPAPTQQSEPENQSNDPKKEEKSELEDSASSCDKSGAEPSAEKCANDYVSPDSEDTLDATWRAIMEGQGKTKTPQLKKSDTCGARIAKAEPFGDNEDGDDNPVAWAQREMKKSETFNDTASLRRDESMSPEELNRRAEAFIQNFNHQIKLQRL